MNTTKEGKEMKLPSVPCKNARQRVAMHGKGIVAVPAALPCALALSLPCRFLCRELLDSLPCIACFAER